MANNFAQFARNITRTGVNLPRAVNAVVIAACYAISDTVIDGTPVDTGEARSNWQVSLGAPVNSVIPAYTPYPKFSHGNGRGIAETANAAAAKAAARAVIVLRQPGQTVYLQNSVEHIQLLNAGSSQQAPAMFVELGVAAGVRSLNGAKLVI